MKTERLESRGARLLRELERAYRTLSPEQQRSVKCVLRHAADGPAEAPSGSGSWTDTVAGLSCGFSTSGS